MASIETIRQYQVPRFKIYDRRSGVVIYPDDVQPDSFEYTAGTETDDGFGPGAVQAQSLTFQIRNHDGSKSGAFMRGDRIELHFGYGKTVETTTWEKLAELDVKDVTRARYNIRVIAYDPIVSYGDRMDEFVMSSPNTIGGVMDHCAKSLGTTLAPGTINGAEIPVDLRDADGTAPQSLGLTFRQELSEACRMSGNWAKMDKDGKLVCGWYPNETSVILPEDFVFDYELGEEPVIYTGVRVAGGDVKGTTAGAVYRMDANTFLTASNKAAAEQAMYDHLNGRRVFSMDVTCVAHLSAIVPGGVMQGTYIGPAPGDDGATFGDKFAIQTPITSISWNGGMLMNVKCTVSDASLGDDRATGGTDAANKAINNQLKNPNSGLNQAIAAGGEGGGGDDDDPVITIKPVEQIYKETRPKDWIPMPSPALGEVFCLFHVPTETEYGFIVSDTHNVQYIEYGTVEGGAFLPKERIYTYDESPDAKNPYEVSDWIGARDWCHVTDDGFAEVMIKIRLRDAKVSPEPTGSWIELNFRDHYGGSATSDGALVNSLNIVEIAANAPNFIIGDDYAPGFRSSIRFFYSTGRLENSVTSTCYYDKLQVIRRAYAGQVNNSHTLLAVHLDTWGWFSGCSSLVTFEADWTEWKPSSLDSTMFKGMKSLEALGDLHFDNAFGIGNIFSGSGIRQIGNIYLGTALEATSSSRYLQMYNTFKGATKLRRVGDIYIGRSEDAEKTTVKLESTFDGSGIRKVPKIETYGAKVEMVRTFNACASLTDASALDVRKCTNASYTFQGSGLKKVGKLDMPICTTCTYMFAASSIETIGDVSAPLVTNATSMFNGCRLMKSIGDVSIGTSVKSTASSYSVQADNLIRYCDVLETVGAITMGEKAKLVNGLSDNPRLKSVGNVTTPGGYSISGLFANDYKLSIVGRIVNGALTMTSLFSNCWNITGPENFGGFAVPAGASLDSMFKSCKFLREAPPVPLNTAKSISAFISDCPNIVKIGTIDAPSLTGTSGPFGSGENMPRLVSLLVSDGSKPMSFGLSNLSWDHGTFMAFIDSLPANDTGSTIYVQFLHIKCYDDITDEDAQVVIGKGYSWKNTA